MKLVTVSGPPSSGKTSVLIKLIGQLIQESKSAGVIKFDCLYANEPALFEKINVPTIVGLSGNLCPDHFFVSNIQEGVNWGNLKTWITFSPKVQACVTGVLHTFAESWPSA